MPSRMLFISSAVFLEDSCVSISWIRLNNPFVEHRLGHRRCTRMRDTPRLSPAAPPPTDVLSEVDEGRIEIEDDPFYVKRAQG